MAFACFDDYLRVAQLLHFVGEQRAKFLAHGGLDASGAAVGNDAFRVQRTEVGACGYVAGPQIDTQSKRLDYTASDLKFDRVIAEQREMARAAARRDARRDG